MFEKNYKIEDFLGTFDNFVTPETCDKLIAAFEKEKKIRNTFNRKESENVSNFFKEDEAFFLSRDHLIGLDQEGIQQVLTNIREVVEIYLKQTDMLKFIGCRELHLSVNKIQKTLPSQGYHLWHVERAYSQACSRVLVYTVYLNDILNGGETEFLFQKKRISPKKGRVCIFPAHFPYVHRGNPPLDGVKYILTSWLHADFQQVY
jgi:hypothetical protein